MSTSAKTFRAILAASAIGFPALILSACTNTKLSSQPSATATSGNGINNLISTFNQFTISTVSVGETATSSSAGYPVTIQFVSTTTTPQMTSDCSTSGLPCVCQFSWTDSSTGTSFTRKVVTAVTAVQSGAIACTTPATSVWLNEIPTNTPITITVLPGLGNSMQFSVNNYTYTKGQNPTAGNFSDNSGNSYVNILRYSCYQQTQKGTQIVSLGATATDNNIGTFTFYDANKFCFYDSTGQLHPQSGSSGCGNLSNASYTYTSQANYFNFYIQSSEVGDINPGNSAFNCPTVKEALNSNGTSGTQGKYWPLDSSFALSLSQTATFNVGVEANTQTTNPNDPTATSTSCSMIAGTSSPTPASTTTATNSAIVSSCLGFAAAPNTNGTCPSLTSTTGGTIPTYRLRRYLALYPPVFDTGGAPLSQPQQVDTIYVIDRPVNGGTGNGYTMLGPKPCPYSYFDKMGVTTGGTSAFVGTNNSSWTGKNIDGVQLPLGDSSNSCTAVLPVPNAAGNAVSLATITTPTYIRPIDAWAPHYEEDTGFQACAPLANPLQDPPLHFAKGASGNVSWCAEAYPTQDDNVSKLDPVSPYHNVKTYTSHVAKNSNSPACASTAMTSLPGSYPSTDYGSHPSASQCDASSSTLNCSQTCDRTVINPTNGINWAGFPLLAPASDVENAISSDSSFGCLITYDNSGASNGGTTKVNSLTPSQGCCGASTNVWTGPQASPRNKSVAHLEPQSVANVATPSCATPNY